MDTWFNDWSDVPDNFTGKCLLIDNYSVCYFKNGTVHRLDGPAIEYNNGRQEYYINGSYSFEEYYWSNPLVVNYPPNILKKINQILEL